MSLGAQQAVMRIYRVVIDSYPAAYDRLALFQHYGATGRVETSHPVIWPEEVVV